MDQKNQTFSPVLPYDITYGEHYRIYDELPYSQDKTSTPEPQICMTSGNVYKYYVQKPVTALKVGGDSTNEAP